MKAKQAEPEVTLARAKRSRYRIANHLEAGVFDSMTGATLWALRNLNDWDWRIEVVTA